MKEEKKMKKRITKIMTTVAVATMVMGVCAGCGNDTKIEDTAATETVQEVTADESTDAANAELVTYEFETYNFESVVLDENSIITQEPSDDPQNSELISEAAINNVIAPGRDFVYLADDAYYYVADISRNLITVADKSKAQVTVNEEAAADADTEELDNPGAFDTDSWSISYDTEKWYGYMLDDGSVIINNLNAVAGTSLIEITEADLATVDEAVTMLEEKTGKKLTAPEKLEKDGTECYVTYDAEEYTGEGVYIFDFFLIYEHNGKVIIVDESITHDDDNERAEALSYEFDDVINTLVLK